MCVVIGGGGHAKVVIDALLRSKSARPVAVLDPDRALWGKKILGVPVLGNDGQIPQLKKQGVTSFVIGVGSVGDSRLRKKLFEACLRKGLKPLIVVHPSAVLSEHASVRGGAVVFARAVINAGATIGRNAIINTSAVVEHDCTVGDHAHVAPSACIAGSVRIGAGAHVGARSVLRQGISVGKDAVVGAGSVVLKSVLARTVVVGSPARLLCKRKNVGAGHR